MSERIHRAKSLFENGYNCSQSVFSVLGNELGLDTNTCLKIAGPFGGGIAKRQETCGAVTGALMAIGLKYGKGENGSEEEKTHTLELSKKFIAEFESKHHTISCKILLDNLDMNSQQGLEEIQKRRLFDNKCVHFVESAVEIAEKILFDTNK